MDNKENLKNYLLSAEELVIDAVNKFRNTSPRGYNMQYKEMLDFCILRNTGLVFNFDYFYYFKYASGLEYIYHMLDNHKAISADINARGPVFIQAIYELDNMFRNILDNELPYSWFKSDEDFNSNYYLEQINILTDYRDTVIERGINALIMESKLSITGIRNKEKLDRLFIDLTIVEREIDMCNEVLYSVFNIE